MRDNGSGIDDPSQSLDAHLLQAFDDLRTLCLTTLARRLRPVRPSAGARHRHGGRWAASVRAKPYDVPATVAYVSRSDMSSTNR